MLQIAIVYICTGRYKIFWKDFYDSSEKYFLTESEKHYFVFSDDDQIINKKNITVIFRPSGGFPMDSLMRFEMFIQIEEALKTFNYIYFFNSNMVFLEPVGTDILPDRSESELVGVNHPGYFNKYPLWFPYERNKRSFAFISSKDRRLAYYMGSLFGGTAKVFLELCHSCDKWIKSDLSNGIMPIYHDESYLNKYFVDKEVLKLNPGYSYPEGWKLPFTPKILIRNKIILGGKYFDKMPDRTMFNRFKQILVRFFKGLIWYLK
jgi:hypothetical protein